jgi:hypothetical protein
MFLEILGSQNWSDKIEQLIIDSSSQQQISEAEASSRLALTEDTKKQFLNFSLIPRILSKYHLLPILTPVKR